MTSQNNQQQRQDNSYGEDLQSAIQNVSESSGDDGGKKPLYNRIRDDIKSGWDTFIHYLKTHALLVFFLFSGLFGWLEAAGVSTGIPDQLTGYVVYYGYTTYFALPIGELIRRMISTDRRPRILAYDPTSSWIGQYAIPRNALGNITWKGPNGEEMNIDDADIVHSTVHGMMYLVQEFDPQNMEGVVTWLAGKNPIDLRAEKKQMEEVSTTTWKLAEAAVKVVSQRENISREAALKEILENVEAREDINLESSTRQTSIEQILKQNDVLQDDIVEQIAEEIDIGD